MHKMESRASADMMNELIVAATTQNPHQALPSSALSQLSLSHLFLQRLCEKKATVSVFLKNGIRLIGTISHFDNKMLLLNADRTQLVYLQAVVTIMPSGSF